MKYKRGKIAYSAPAAFTGMDSSDIEYLRNWVINHPIANAANKCFVNNLVSYK